MTAMRIKMCRTGGECVGAVTMPTDTGGVITATAKGADKGSALHAAALLAERIATDPIMSAILPPGTGAALAATKQLAAAARIGLPALKGVWSSIRGKGKKRVARALARDRAKVAPEEVGDVGFDAATAMGIATGPAGYAAAKGAKALWERRKRKKEAAKRRKRKVRLARKLLAVKRRRAAAAAAARRPPEANRAEMPEPTPEPRYEQDPVVTYDEPPYDQPTSIAPPEGDPDEGWDEDGEGDDMEGDY